MTGAGVIHVIDDDPSVRDAVGALMSATGRTVETYPSAQDFLAGLDTAARGAVITDVQMPAMSGLELLRLIASRRDDFPVIVLTGAADVPMAVEALKAGAADFIEKPFESVTILAAVQKALMSMARANERTEHRSESAGRVANLSGREREVLRGLVAGRSSKEIARELSISPRTVETYRANIMMKMQAQSLSELVRMALLAEGQL